MAATSRIRVLIAGNVYVKRALVRRFLEDDGYEVVAEVLTAEAVLAAARAGRPDAVVLDEDLTAGAPIPAIRAAAPDARVVVFTAAAPGGSGTPPPGADAYLDKGEGLSALTALLGRLFAQDVAPLEPLLDQDPAPLEPLLVSAGVAAGAAAASTAVDPTEASMADTQIDPVPARRTGPSGSMVYRLVAIIAGGLLIVWGVIAAIQGEDTGGTAETVAEGGGTVDAGGDIVAEAPASELDKAYASLDTMISALEGGNYILATIEAQSLMDLRERALAAGFAVTGFDAEVTARLGAIVPDLPARVSTQLADILGSLFPALPEETKPGGGSGVVLGTTVTNEDGGTTGGGGDTGGDTGGGDQEPTPEPGDGKVWGQWHKENRGGGGPPPWANGHK